MIEKKTIVDQIEITRTGHIQIRFGLLLVEDGAEIGCQWHRTAIEPGGDVDAQIAAVEQHLASMGRPAVDRDGLMASLKPIARVAHTPEVVQRFRASRRSEA